MELLEVNEKIVMRELIRIADIKWQGNNVVYGQDLISHNFAEFVMKTYSKNVAYPSSLQSRMLQTLRDKGYIKMERKNGGTYTILCRV